MVFWYVGKTIRCSARDALFRSVGHRLPHHPWAPAAIVIDIGFALRAYGYTLLFAVRDLVVVMVARSAGPAPRRRAVVVPGDGVSRVVILA